MYPTGELNRLAERKRSLCRAIALTRLECTASAAEAIKPLEWLDRARARWRRIAPLAKLLAVPAALLLRRGWKARSGLTGATGGVWRWLPVVIGAMRMWNARRRA